MLVAHSPPLAESSYPASRQLTSFMAEARRVPAARGKLRSVSLKPPWPLPAGPDAEG
jgi:hypothetical protein